MRSTPVRQAVLLVAVVALVNLASLGVAWLTQRANTLQDLRADLDREMASFEISASPSALRTLVEARARVTELLAALPAAVSLEARCDAFDWLLPGEAGELRQDMR